MFLTTIGKEGQGEGVNTGQDAYDKYLHDLLIIAARENLDVAIQTKDLTGKHWGKQILPTLQAGCIVRIFYWGPINREMIKNLDWFIEADRHFSCGNSIFFISCSGTIEGIEEIIPFVVATDQEKTSWCTVIFGENNSPKFAAMFRTKRARENGERLLEVFNKVFAAVPKKNKKEI